MAFGPLFPATNIFTWVGIDLYRKQTTRNLAQINSPQTPCCCGRCGLVVVAAAVVLALVVKVVDAAVVVAVPGGGARCYCRFFVMLSLSPATARP